MDGGNKNRSKEVQLILGFGSRYIRMEKQNLCNQPQHSWDKGLMMMMVNDGVGFTHTSLPSEVA